MGDDITIGVTEIVNNIEVTAQPNDQIVDINVTDNSENVTLNITPTVIEINVNKGSSYARWGSILGTLTDQTDLANALILKADLIDGLVPSYQLPSYVDDVIEVANYAALPASGETGKIYITLDTNHIYRWSGSTYIEITDNTAVWGAITGTLSSQTDLVNALNLRVPYTGATSNVNLGEYGLTGGFLALDTTPTSTPTGIGTIYWDSANRTAALIDGDGDTTLQIGQEERILVHNNTGATLTDGQVVYVTGSTGNLPSVSLANASSETTSAATLGVVTESIAHGADGFITTSGIVNGLNTLAFNEGDLLWLGTTAGTFTATKPISPNHLVLIGYVIKKAGGNGSILVKIQNTQELDESSDVLFTSLTNNDILTYESSTDLWKNKSIATILGYTPANDSAVVHIEGVETVNGIKTFSNSTKFDYGINLKQDTTTAYFPNYTTIDGYNNGYIVNNGDARAAIFYLANNVSRVYNFPDANGTFALTSDLSSAISGTTNYIPKFTSSNALGNSLIYDNGTNVFVGGSGSNGNRFTVVEGGTTLVGQQILMQNASSSNDALNIVHSGTGKLIKGTKGVEVFNITNSGGAYFAGNVGIVTTSPTSPLHVKGSGSYAGVIVDNTGTTGGGYFAARQNGSQVGIVGVSGAIIGDTSSNMALFSETGKSVDFMTDGSATIKMRITSGGNVGIGTTSPSAALTVSGVNVGAAIDWNNTTSSTGRNFRWVSLNTGGFAIEDITAGSERMRITSGGETYIQAGTSYQIRIQPNCQINSFLNSSGASMYLNFQGNGAIYAGSSYAVLYAGSDRRIKTDIKDAESTLEKILNLTPRTFRYKERPNDVSYGFIAQEVEDVMPEIVKTSEGISNCDGEEILDQKSVESYGLAWASILVKAMQEQNVIIQELKVEIELLKAK